MQIIKTARGRITTYHGEDAGRSRPHVGIDIGHGDETAEDLRMVAPAAGRVIAAGWDGTYGYRVIIQHPDGSRSLVAHMSSLAVGVGWDVDQRDDIGVMGRTGGPWGSVAGWFVHGHQEYHIGGIAVDPLAYMSGGIAAAPAPAPAPAPPIINLEDTMDAYEDAGPAGGSPAKDSGIFFIGCANAPKGRAWRRVNNTEFGPNPRELIKAMCGGKITPLFREDLDRVGLQYNLTAR